MNCWSITTSAFDGPVSSDQSNLVQLIKCELRRNDELMVLRVVPVDLVSEIIPAMQMIGQGMAVIEINSRMPPIDLVEHRVDILLEKLAEEFGAAPTAEFVIKTVDKILERGGITKPPPRMHLVIGDQHPELGEGQQSDQPMDEAVHDSSMTEEQDARTDPHTEGAEPRGGKTCDPD